jgi:hypothetical protein
MSLPNLADKIVYLTRDEMSFVDHDYTVKCVACGRVKQAADAKWTVQAVEIVMEYCSSCDPASARGRAPACVAYDKDGNKIKSAK